jgi:amino acid permease
MFRRKRLAQFAAEAEAEAEAEETRNDDGLKLSLFDLLCIGIGGTVGSGVFVLTGEVLPLAGPESYLCWILGGKYPAVELCRAAGSWAVK